MSSRALTLLATFAFGACALLAFVPDSPTQVYRWPWLGLYCGAGLLALAVLALWLLAPPESGTPPPGRLPGAGMALAAAALAALAA